VSRGLVEIPQIVDTFHRERRANFSREGLT
jgi:hypothetical protein